MEVSSLRPPSRVSSAWRIGIVHSEFHREQVWRLVEAAERTLREAGIPEYGIRRFAAPGSFEIPLIGAALFEEKEVDALIGLGVIVQGETHHAELLAESVARGIMDVQLKYLSPFAFEVLFVSDLAQAEARSGEHHNKGEEAAIAVLHALARLAPIQQR